MSAKRNRQWHVRTRGEPAPRADAPRRLTAAEASAVREWASVHRSLYWIAAPLLLLPPVIYLALAGLTSLLGDEDRALLVVYCVSLPGGAFLMHALINGAGGLFWAREGTPVRILEGQVRVETRGRRRYYIGGKRVRFLNSQLRDRVHDGSHCVAEIVRARPALVISVTR